jgi:hypothetical protein
MLTIALFLLQTLKTEGLFGLYKGFVPNWLRIGPHTIIVSVLNTLIFHPLSFFIA